MVHDCANGRIGRFTRKLALISAFKRYILSKGINKVILVGHIGADPEIRYTSNNLPVGNIRLATSDNWKDKQTGERREATEWHRLVLFGRLAEIARDYTHKGSQVYIEGRLQTRKWQDRDGNDRYTTEVVVNDLTLLGSRGADAAPGDSHGSFQEDGGNAPPASPGDNGGGQPGKAARAPDQGGDGDIDDDIPF